MSYDEPTMNKLDGMEINQPPTVEVDLQELSDLFDKKCQDKHNLGEQKYGPGTWLGVDTIAMMQDEIIDMVNYARFSWIKLEIARRYTEAVSGVRSEVAQPLPGMEMLGKQSFRRSGLE